MDALIYSHKVFASMMVLIPETVSPCHCKGVQRPKQSHVFWITKRLPRSLRDSQRQRGNCDTVSMSEGNPSGQGCATSCSEVLRPKLFKGNFQRTTITYPLAGQVADLHCHVSAPCRVYKRKELLPPGAELFKGLAIFTWLQQ